MCFRCLEGSLQIFDKTLDEIVACGRAAIFTMTRRRFRDNPGGRESRKNREGARMRDIGKIAITTLRRIESRVIA